MRQIKSLCQSNMDIMRHRKNHFSLPADEGVKLDKHKPEKREGYTEFKRRIIQSESEKKFKDFDKYEEVISLTDLNWYFNFKARECNEKYLFLNEREAKKHFKTLKKTYSNRDIKDVIDFIFDSDQNYINKKSISPRILVSQWMNTIYSDTLKWKEGKYVPKKRAEDLIEEREWNKSDKQTKVGEW